MNAWKRITFTCLSLLVLGLVPIGAAFAQVKVTAANPSSATQGTISLDVTVTGSGFNKSAKAQYFVSGSTTNTGGITVKGTAFKSSTELVTTIDVAETAQLASFDIVVTLADTGRKGKGTTLFSVTAKPTKTTPTYPQARFYHAFTNNGGTTSATSRLYMFGGMSSSSSVIGDLWSYANAGSGATWTFIPGGTSAPSPRRSVGWSCGAGQCVAANGVATGFFNETWVFSESTRTWSQVSCGRRVLCPSGRMGPAMAYDQLNGVHVLFGGEGSGDPMLLADTYIFNAASKVWTQVATGTAPPARTAAAAVYVPGAGVVMFGGWGNPCCITTLNDMYVWNGTAWAIVAPTVISDPPRAVPMMANHSMAWDETRNAIIVTNGFTTSWHTPNNETWYVTLSKSAGAWQATWTLASGIGCQSTAGSPPDPVVHPGAMMTRDAVGGVQVSFGGETPDGNSAYGNTVECR